MRTITLITLLILVLALLPSCVKKSVFEKVKAENEKLRTELAAIKSEADKSRDALQKVSAELAVSQSKAAKSEEQVSKLATELAKKPAMPLKLAFRPAILGSGSVAKITNETSRELLVLMTVRNPTLDKTEKFQVRIARSGLGVSAEFGHAEGWAFSSGDQVMISHADYEPLQITVP